MSRERISRNAPCPCGSGKKYKHCCLKKGIAFTENAAGSVQQSIPLTDDLADVLRVQRERFIARFGREPGPDDPIFFDLPHTEHLEHMMTEDMRAAGIDPAIIYAFEQTGRLVTADNQHLIPEKDLEAWDAAIRGYERDHGRATPRKPDRRRTKGQAKFPIGTVALYGPDDRTTTKIVAAVIRHDGAEPILMRWVGTHVATSLKIQTELKEFFDQHGVRSVAASEGNLGCPHEEGEDFPLGEDCTICPFWKGKQGSNRQE